MKKKVFVLCCFLFITAQLFAQRDPDTLTEETKHKIFNSLKNFTFGFYVDSYVTMQFDHKKDTTHIVPYFANCPMTDQIRLNVAAIEIYYNAERVRGKLQLQYGDAPNLLAAPEKQFIKTMRQAAFGFRIVKNLWVDMGYMFTPVGGESAWPVTNPISTATICSYFEAGAVLGVKLSYKFSDKVDGGIMFGNPYSLAYEQTNHIAGILFINYMPVKNLVISYNNLWGNQALKNAELDNNLLYNDVIVSYDPTKNLNITGQFDFAFQSNSHMPPDSNDIGSMCSGFLRARYSFLNHFSVAGRYEYYYDPQGFLSGTFTYDGKTTGLATSGIGLSLEYKPVIFSYIRMEYKYIQANTGNKVYYSGNSDHLNALIFTVGVRF